MYSAGYLYSQGYSNIDCEYSFYFDNNQGVNDIHERSTDGRISTFEIVNFTGSSFDFGDSYGNIYVRDIDNEDNFSIGMCRGTMYLNDSSFDIDSFVVSSGSGGGSSSGSSDGDNTWTKVSATGYVPYWYCPQTKTTIPSTKQTNSNVCAYRNTSTGAYKVEFAGTSYTAHNGYNKLTLDTDVHSYYNSTYKYWSSCTDYYYYEFTIND